MNWNEETCKRCGDARFIWVDEESREIPCPECSGAKDEPSDSSK